MVPTTDAFVSPPPELFICACAPRNTSKLLEGRNCLWSFQSTYLSKCLSRCRTGRRCENPLVRLPFLCKESLHGVALRQLVGKGWSVFSHLKMIIWTRQFIIHSKSKGHQVYLFTLLFHEQKLWQAVSRFSLCCDIFTYIKQVKLELFFLECFRISKMILIYTENSNIPKETRHTPYSCLHISSPLNIKSWHRSRSWSALFPTSGRGCCPGYFTLSWIFCAALPPVHGLCLSSVWVLLGRKSSRERPVTAKTSFLRPSTVPQLPRRE